MYLKSKCLILNDISEFASLHCVLTMRHFVCFVLKLSKLRNSSVLLSLGSFPLVYSKGFLTALFSWSFFVPPFSLDFRILECPLTLVKISSSIWLENLCFTLLPFPLITPFNDFILVLLRCFESIAQ